VAHLFWVQGVAGSNPVSPTISLYYSSKFYTKKAADPLSGGAVQHIVGNNVQQRFSAGPQGVGQESAVNPVSPTISLNFSFNQR
ncbi:hypothetical protein, partial [Alteromonas oceani]|uniref:hypothetical protein n=1 Tax=Alteromonas oceani TaxID=2071609 RepID=UPI0019D1540E